VLCSYAGTYELTPDITTVVRCTEEGLTSERTGRPAATYLPEVRDVFFVPGQPRSRRIFTRDANGRVDGFGDRREGKDIRWRRTGPAHAAGTADPDPAVEETIKALDTEYQSAVQRRDLETMARILADDFILVTGTGRVSTKADVLAEIADPALVFERQESSRQTVRVWGDTAVITALLWAQGTRAGAPFEYRLWFSDTYARTPGGWRYVFGQAAQPLAP
jgi:ketosteroid isomerase-like protein